MKTKKRFIFYLLFPLIAFIYSCGGDKSKRAVEENQDIPVFRDDFDGTLVNEDVWEVGTWTEHGGQLSPERVFIKDGVLNMLLINENDTIKSSAIQSRETFLYGKWETRLKVSSVPGVLNSFYTIDWGDGKGTRQEVDIEFLTFSFGEQTGEVHLAVHAAGLKSFETRPDLKLDFNPSDEFHVWGLEITPEFIEWSVDGKSLLVYKYDEHEVKVDKPYMLKLNTRSQENWIKGPSEPGVESVYLIDWIQFTPY